MEHPPLLKAERVTKRFPGVIALREVDLTVHAGEVVAVVGENGAGKSTLMKICAGVLGMDEGSLDVDGSPAVFSTARQAAARGIVLIHQELNLLSNLSVSANMFLGREAHRAGWISRRVLTQKTRECTRRVGLKVDPDTPVHTLSIGQRQLLEVARALSAHARLIIMDEPTSSLSKTEAERLFGVIAELKAGGVAILYVSHRLHEVEAIADRVVVLKDGENAAELHGADIRRETMVRCMVGRDIQDYYVHRDHRSGIPVLEVKQLRSPAWPHRTVSLTLRQGEIVGLAGLVGAGRTELLATLFGLHPTMGGEMYINGEKVRVEAPHDAMSAGMALVPEDRAQQGLVLSMMVQHNMTMAVLARNRRAWVSRQWDGRYCQKMIRRLHIDEQRTTSVVRLLSGGNQQKVVLGKWLLLKPYILLLDEPTRGIDVGAKQEIYRVMEELAAEGMAILFASSEMEEVMGIADRVLVMHQGGITGELSRDQMTEEAIMHLATGQAPVLA